MSEPLQFFIRTLGCKVNQVESESVLSELYLLGLTPTADPTVADIAIVNTCSVTAEADAKTRKAIRKIVAVPGVQKIYVTGCSAVMHRETLSQISEKVCILEDKTKISEKIAQDFISEKSDGSLDDAHSGTPGAVAVASSGTDIDSKFFHTRAFIKVQDGCENFCSYCIVPYARGRSISVPFGKVRAEIDQALQRNAREIVLTGINIGRYKDSSSNISSLDELATSILETPIERVRISSIEPPDITPQFIETLATHTRICPHIHLPLQSGSATVLTRMSRRYTPEEYEEIASSLRREISTLALTTDIIVGFPGETDSEFQETIDFCTRMKFSKIHVFKYSVRPGTPAAEMQQVSPEVISKRAALLRGLSDSMRRAYIESFSGEPVELLVERIEDGFVVGTSREYISYKRPLTEAMLIEQVKLGSIIEVVG